MKSALILAVTVLAAVTFGAWSYYRAVVTMLHNEDRNEAIHLAKSLSLAAESDLRDKRYKPLRDLIRDWAKEPGVVYVGVRDRHGYLASECGQLTPWSGQFADHLRPNTVTLHDGRHLAVVRAIISREKVWLDDQPGGTICLVVDTEPTKIVLAGVRQKVIRTAGLIFILALPLSYWLVARVMVRPIRHLAEVTHRLADGDFDARTEMKRSDETGELATAFDHMAEQVCQMRQRLLDHKQKLESQVTARTEELQLANARLREEMKDKEEFLRAVSHDLNAPMRNIAGMATMIAMKFGDQLPEDVTARLQRIQCNVDQLSSLIGELLELSRIKTRPETRSEVDFGELLESLKELFEYELQKRHITLVIQSPMPTLSVEPNRMRQLFQNLIDNAIKYMHRPIGGYIEIGYRFDGRMHCFSVADNGPGIDPAQQQLVFSVFRRGPARVSSQADGKGVGLAVVRTVASTYDGRAWVESVSGEGTTFFVTLADACTRPSVKEVLADA